MDSSAPGFPVLHHLPEFAQVHVHWVGDATQPFHPLSPTLLLPSIFPSIRVFSNESALRIRWPKYWSFSWMRSALVLNFINPHVVYLPSIPYLHSQQHENKYSGHFCVYPGMAPQDSSRKQTLLVKWGLWGAQRVRCGWSKDPIYP